MDNLLALTTEALEEVMGFEDWDKSSQPPPYIAGRTIIIPEYNDGYLVHGSSKFWQSGCNGKFYAISPYGKRERFTDVCKAITFAMTV